MEQKKIIHIYFANGVEWAADETSLISSEVECMGLKYRELSYWIGKLCNSIRAISYSFEDKFYERAL